MKCISGVSIFWMKSEYVRFIECVWDANRDHLLFLFQEVKQWHLWKELRIIEASFFCLRILNKSTIHGEIFQNSLIRNFVFKTILDVILTHSRSTKLTVVSTEFNAIVVVVVEDVLECFWRWSRCDGIGWVLPRGWECRSTCTRVFSCDTSVDVWKGTAGNQNHWNLREPFPLVRSILPTGDLLCPACEMRHSQECSAFRRISFEFSRGLTPTGRYEFVCQHVIARTAWSPVIPLPKTRRHV